MIYTKNEYTEEKSKSFFSRPYLELISQVLEKREDLFFV